MAVRTRIYGTSSQNDEQKDVLLKADAVVVACGSYREPLLRSVGVSLPIYPDKGYSATFKILRSEPAPQVSTIDVAVKYAMSRLGGELRVAGTIELGGYDTSLTTPLTPLAKARCAMLVHRVEQVLPDFCNTRLESEGGTPNFLDRLRPRHTHQHLLHWPNPSEKTLVQCGPRHAGLDAQPRLRKALAELVSGHKPDLAFKFYGV